MNPIDTLSSEVAYPVAIQDRDLAQIECFTLEAHELCTICGERFGIGYLQPSHRVSHTEQEAMELPKKLTEILAKDHFRNQEHRHLIELDE